MLLTHIRRMAGYNVWANTRLYDACAKLASREYHAPRKAFFGSIHGTLNHLMVADRLWLARILGEPSPGYRLDQELYPDLRTLRAARDAEDAKMIDLLHRADEAHLEQEAAYRMIVQPGVEMRTPMSVCWLHMFNHQTHHRGQVHDQLSQTPVPPPSLDLIAYTREAA